MSRTYNHSWVLKTSIVDFLNFKITHPLFNLTKKDSEWIWFDKAQATFQALKDVFISDPVLIMPDIKKPYCIEVNTFDYATKVILFQLKDNKQWHLYAFLSKSLNDTQYNYNINNKEHLEGIKHKIKILTNHKNLEYFTQN